MKMDLALRKLIHAHLRTSAISMVALAALTVSTAPAEPKSDGAPNTFAEIAERVQPAVIGVISKSAEPEQIVPDLPFSDMPDEDTPDAQASKPSEKDPNVRETIAIGSGFFISPDGYAVTNSHVVKDNGTAEIRTTDKKTYSAKVIGRDPLSDLALIKVDGRTDFGYVKVAEQSPRVGDWVLTAGNPFGLGGTVTAGIVSAREREIENGPTDGFLQIDAPINSGDSGGPTLDTNGDVIGVNSMILSLSGGWAGVAFAIPAETVRSVIPQLKEKGTVTRGSIGVEVQSVTPEISDSLGADDLHGAIVTNVQTNGSAAKAGLRSGDVITKVEGDAVRSASELTKKIHAMAPGSSAQLAMVRAGKQSILSVTLDQLPREPRQRPPINPE
ncbi:MULTISPECIES: S1C family serine protease [Bradyrhizobium]|nr:trypsin-like peptidase domain-containing protein [Bradyrhizobium vignae]